jgi:integrase
VTGTGPTHTVRATAANLWRLCGIPHNWHTFASALISAGCSVKAVQSALGHESAAVTLDTYGHLWPSDEDKTRAAIDAFLGGSDSTPRVRSVSDAGHS